MRPDARGLARRPAAGWIYRCRLSLLCCAAALASHATADHSDSNWIEVSSTEDVEAALAAGNQATFLQLSDAVARCD